MRVEVATTFAVVAVLALILGLSLLVVEPSKRDLPISLDQPDADSVSLQGQSSSTGNLSVSAVPVGEQDMSVSGVVIARLSGLPIVGAHVLLSQNGQASVESASEGDGTFKLPLGAVEPLDLVVAAKGFASARVRGVSSGQHHRVAMEPAATLRVLVRSAAGEPVIQAHVLVVAHKGSWHTSTDAGGECLLQVTSNTRVVVYVSHPDFEVGELDLPAHVGDRTANLTLHDGNASSGTVVDVDTSMPISGAEIQLLDGVSSVVRSDENGTFRVFVRSMSHETQRLAISSPGYARLLTDLPQRREFTVSLERGIQLRGRATLADAGLAEAQVAAFRIQSNDGVAKGSLNAATGSQGEFAVENLVSNASYWVEARHPLGVAGMRVDTPSRSAHLAPIVLHLEPPSEIRGRVLDGRGKVVANARVQLRRLASHDTAPQSVRIAGIHRPDVWMTTDSEGAFVFRSVVPGSATLIASKWPFSARSTMLLRSGDSHEIELSFVPPKGRSVNVRVLNPRGAAASNVWVHSHGSATAYAWMTDQSGWARAVVPEGFASIQVLGDQRLAERGWGIPGPARVAPDAGEIVIQLKSDQCISGRVVDGDGRGLANLEVRAMSDEDEELSRSVTNAGGACQLSCQPRHVARIELSGNRVTVDDGVYVHRSPWSGFTHGPFAYEGDFRIRAERDRNVASIRIVVIGPQGEVAPKSRVSARVDQGPFSRYMTDTGGRVTLEGLAPEGRVVIWAEPSELQASSGWLQASTDEFLAGDHDEVSVTLRQGLLLEGDVEGEEWLGAISVKEQRSGIKLVRLKDRRFRLWIGRTAFPCTLRAIRSDGEPGPELVVGRPSTGLKLPTGSE